MASRGPEPRPHAATDRPVPGARRSPASAVHRTTVNSSKRCLIVHAQLTVRLPEDLSRALKAASRRMQRKNSEIVRLALREFLGASERPAGRPADRVRHLIGSLESGVPRLAEDHRAHIVESLRRRR
jgi:hypothetical protein